ncbi:hypothetical protein CDAR_370301 [Caerostris darwini]|uniref:Uncharacterized protein n=1 Tax=Caerostris darwini TaxID=1538125 RepID=A0AAV4NQI2_9ARAC|nr:hypothetical protein CDAR_370301 [Caerostris darwini]
MLIQIDDSFQFPETQLNCPQADMDAGLLGKDHSWGHAPGFSIWIYLGKFPRFRLLWSIFHGPRNSCHLGVRLIFIALVCTRVLSCLQTLKEHEEQKEHEFGE